MGTETACRRRFSSRRLAIPHLSLHPAPQAQDLERPPGAVGLGFKSVKMPSNAGNCDRINKTLVVAGRVTSPVSSPLLWRKLKAG
ncbi:hypothetical protein Golomagni_01228 [Golovinomyces magnicellulatus]|nr:hypothetical protein Golomagni_01228 [Golovinomyces magnicellulatus]